MTAKSSPSFHSEFLVHLRAGSTELQLHLWLEDYTPSAADGAPMARKNSLFHQILPGSMRGSPKQRLYIGLVTVKLQDFMCAAAPPAAAPPAPPCSSCSCSYYSSCSTQHTATTRVLC